MSYDPTAAARRRAQKRDNEARPHGWSRASDKPNANDSGAPKLRQANGTPILVLTVLVVLSAVGLARVQARTRVLETASDITKLTEEQKALLDRKRRLETERAYLRHPERIRLTATQELGMKTAPPERIQRIRVQTPELDLPGGDKP